MITAYHADMYSKEQKEEVNVASKPFVATKVSYKQRNLLIVPSWFFFKESEFVDMICVIGKMCRLWPVCVSLLNLFCQMMTKNLACV